MLKYTNIIFVRWGWNITSHFRQIQLEVKGQNVIKCIRKHVTRIRGARPGSIMSGLDWM